MRPYASLFALTSLMVAPNMSAAASEPGKLKLISDFTERTSDLGWYVVNDNVMGGRSDGDFRLDENALHFSGRTNTDGGGFSSIRTAPLQLDLSAYDGIQLRVRGDGRRYTWRLSTDARWRGRRVSYWAEFDTADGEWTTARLPFDRFEPKFRGFKLDGPAPDPSKISGMGLMIYDARDGEFNFEMANISAYRNDAPFSLADYRWERRVLVVSGSGPDDGDIARQLAAVADSSEMFAERDMVLVTLLDDGISTAGDRQLSTDEAAAIREKLGIEPGNFALRLVGKDGGVKRSGEQPIPMDDIYALIDTMPMRMRETRQR